MSKIEQLARRFTRKWVCDMVTWGFDEQLRCDENNPHTTRGHDTPCGFYWTATFSDDAWKKLTGG